MARLTPSDVRRALDAVARRGFRGLAYRHHAPAYGALSGEGARIHGGRWNPPGGFPVVYAALDPVTVDAEFRRLTERARLSPAALQPRQLSSLRLDLKNVLDLRQPSVQEALGIQPAELLAEDPALPRLIGEVAHEMGYEAVVAPSAAGAGDVIAIFPANRGPDSQLQVAGARPYRPDVAD